MAVPVGGTVGAERTGVARSWLLRITAPPCVLASMAAGVADVRTVWAASDAEPCVAVAGTAAVRKAGLASRGVACTLLDGFIFVEAAARDAGPAACDAGTAEDTIALLTSGVVVCGGTAMCEGAGRGPRRLEVSRGPRRLEVSRGPRNVEASPGLESRSLVAPVIVSLVARAAWPEESVLGVTASGERWWAE